MVDVTEILQHWYAGRPKVEVARSLGVDAKTVRRYVAPAEAAGMVPGGPPVTEQQWRALARGWFPQVAGTGIRQVSWREIAVHHDRIAELLGVVPVSVIHQRLADEQGLTASVASVRRYVRAHFPEGVRAEEVRPPRPPVPPGAEALCGFPHRASYAARANMRRQVRQRLSCRWSRVYRCRIFTGFPGRRAACRGAGTGLGGFPAARSWRSRSL